MSTPSDLPLDPPPRKAHLRRGIRNVRRAYRTMFTLVILVFGGWAALDAFRWYDLTYNVRSADGKILDMRTIPRHATNEYRLEYEFPIDDGERIVSESVIAQAIFERAAVGQPCVVVYLPENPRVDHWLFNNDAIHTHVMYLTLGHGVAALLAVVVLRLVERPLRKELRLARTGVVTQGRIVSIGKPRGRRGTVKITYSFPAAAGKTTTGVCNLPRRFRVETIAPGANIDVVVDPKDASIHKPRFALDFVEFGDVGRKKTTES